jgi:hypothetical protein
MSKKPVRDVGYPSDYFPRSFHYKKDAQYHVDVIVNNGGLAEIKPNDCEPGEFKYPHEG